MRALFKAFLEFYGESEIGFFLPFQRCKISLICIKEKRLLITWCVQVFKRRLIWDQVEHSSSFQSGEIPKNVRFVKTHSKTWSIISSF